MYFCVYPPSLISFTQPFLHNARPLEDIQDNCPLVSSLPQTTSNSIANSRLCWTLLAMNSKSSMMTCWVLRGGRPRDALLQTWGKHSDSLECKWLILYDLSKMVMSQPIIFFLENTYDEWLIGLFIQFTKSCCEKVPVNVCCFFISKMPARTCRHEYNSLICIVLIWKRKLFERILMIMKEAQVTSSQICGGNKWRIDILKGRKRGTQAGLLLSGSHRNSK